MNQKTSHLLMYLSFCLLGGGVLHGRRATAGLTETLTEKLQKYCVPKEEEGCGVWRACYRSSACDCGSSPNLVYSEADRRCVGKCSAGQKPGAEVHSCAGGQQRNVVKSSEDC